MKFFTNRLIFELSKTEMNVVLQKNPILEYSNVSFEFSNRFDIFTIVLIYNSNLIKIQCHFHFFTIIHRMSSFAIINKSIYMN